MQNLFKMLAASRAKDTPTIKALLIGRQLCDYSLQFHLQGTFITIFKIPVSDFYSFLYKYIVCLIPLLSFDSEIFNFKSVCPLLETL